MFTLQVHPPKPPSPPLPSPPCLHHHPTPPPSTPTPPSPPACLTQLPADASCVCSPQCRRKSPGPRRPLGPASSRILLPDILITPPPHPHHPSTGEPTPFALLPALKRTVQHATGMVRCSALTQPDTEADCGRLRSYHS